MSKGGNMNLYRLSQEMNTGLDTYDGVIVCAENEAEARTIQPNGSIVWGNSYTWCGSPDSVEVELLGKAREGLGKGIILASFNAG